MNFPNLYTILISLFLYTAFPAAAQKPFKQADNKNKGIPYIEKISLRQYGISNKNYDLLLDDKGLLLIANENHLVQFDGNYWTEINTNDTPAIAKGEDGNIYVGAKNSFGILSLDSHGKPTIKKLNTRTYDSLPIRHIKSIATGKDEVIFCNQNTIFLYKNKEIKTLLQNNEEVEIFKVKHDIYVQVIGKGLFAFSNGKIHKLPGSDNFSNTKLDKILNYNKFLLLREKGSSHFMLYNFSNKIPYQTDADDYINKYKFTDAVVLEDGTIAVGTESGGLVFINRRGKEIMKLGLNEGLFSSKIKTMNVDQSNNLWILHNDGISRLNMATPFSHFSTSQGLYGNVNDIHRYKEDLYIATSDGIFRLSKNRIHQFESVKGEVLKIESVYNDLFIHAQEGIYRLENGEFRKEMGKYNFVMNCQKHLFKAIFTSDSTLEVFNYSNSKISPIKEHTNLPFKITSISEDKDGDFWIQDKDNKLYYIPAEVLLNHKGRLDFTKFEKAHPRFEWISMHPTLSEGLFFSTNKGIYRFNKFSRKFYQDSILKTNQNFPESWVSPITEDNKGNIWLYLVSQKGKKSDLLVSKKVDGVRNLSIVQEDVFRNRTIKSIYTEKNGIIWLGSINSIIRLDTDKFTRENSSFSSILHKASFGNNSTVFMNGNHSEDELIHRQIPYTQNKVRFEFSATDYEHIQTLEYSFKLDGFDKAWSKWIPNTYVDYTNLPKGSYTFAVKAKNIKNIETAPVYFSFSIKAPLYKSFYAFILYGFLIALATIVFIKGRALKHAKEKFHLEAIINKRTEDLLSQKEKSDNLLAKVLPKETAHELMQSGKVSSQKYQMVTVLFSDIQGFTKISDQINPEALLDELDNFFQRFDTVVEKYNIEKIKTIGDAYMCAGGIPEKNSTNPIEVALAALEMQQYLRMLNEDKIDDESKIWDLRIGLDTGPVIAGVVGQKKLSYDIWGSTVNVASRMESSGEIGHVNISANTYLLIKDYFDCKYRGKIPVKNKGTIDMYYIEGIRSELSVGGAGLKPNKQFFVNLQLLRLNDLEELIFDKIEHGLPSNIHFHNLNHTLSVYAIAELLGKEEGLTLEEILLVRTAALFHDTGFLISSEDHEEISVKLAKEILPEYKYSSEQIRHIERLILSTKSEYEPISVMEKVLNDADNDHYGREDYVRLCELKYLEDKEHKRFINKKAWFKDEQYRLQSFNFYTRAAESYRRIDISEQTKNLNEYIMHL